MKKEFQIHSQGDQEFLAIKAGFSWPAFLLTWLWCLSKQLYLQAGGLFLLMIALVIAWKFQPEGAVFFGLLGVVTALVAGNKAGAWLARKAERTGYVFRGVVMGDTAAGAIALFRRSDPEALRRRAVVSGGFFNLVPPALQPVAAIVALTWKAALRYKLFVAVAVLLVGSVVVLPLLIKDDGTARGFAQILLTYTLSTITLLLGLATLWLSCGVLARDIEDCQMQMVVVKPIPRWQVWLGKWLGVVSLNAALLTVSGGSVYGLLMYRAAQLPEREQTRLRSEILVARGSLKEEAFDVKAAVDRYLADRVRNANTNGMDFQYERMMLERQARAQMEVVPPNNIRSWRIPINSFDPSLNLDRFQLRFRFYGADTNSLKEHTGEWTIGSGQNAIRSNPLPLAANTFHEQTVWLKPLGETKRLRDLLTADSELIIQYRNSDTTAVVFPIEDGLEMLYHEGGFALNYIRGLLIVLFWLSLLAALGLAASSYMTFPVACFCSIGILIVVFSSGTLSTTVSEGTIMGVDHETGEPIAKNFDSAMLPVFSAMLKVINLAQDFSPVDSLSTGRSITWARLAQAFAQIVLLLGGLLAASGMWLFYRRELATAQSNQ